MMNRLLSAAALAAGVLTFALLPGCGDGKLTCHPVRGQVFVDGKPAHGAKVFFFPVSPPSDPRANCPIGHADEAGNFAVTTYVEGDGAPAAEYVLCVEWPAKHPIKGTFEGGDRLGGKYYNKEKSEFKFTVKPGQNEVPKFDLKGGKPDKGSGGILGGGGPGDR